MKKIVNIGLLLYCLSIVLLGTSCMHGNKYPKEVASLDSLKTQLHKADSVITKVDTDRIKKACDHIMVSLEFIKMAHKDTMSASSAQIFREFNSVRWSLETFLGKRNVVKSEINKSIAQVSHLSHDLANNLIKADSVTYYYNFEVKKASELVETVKFAMVDVNNQLPMYNMIAPQADSLISRLKNHKDL